MMNFLANGGAMAAAIREHDWSGTPVGPPEGWPALLKTSVALVLASRFPQCLVWGPELITIPNDAFLPILGNKPQALGRPFSEVWVEAWDEIGPIAELAFAGEPTFIENFPLVVRRGAQPEQAWFTFCYSPIRDEEGRVVGMLDTVVETTQTVLSRMQSDVIARELVHRIKNAIAVVHSVAALSLRGDITLAQARERLLGRLEAMAQTHDVLLQSEANEGSVEQVVRQALAEHLADAGRIVLKGPPVTLPGRQTLSLALAIHELATNAVKYGALSCNEGCVHVTWQAGREGSDEDFVLEWRETGGPIVEPMRKAGFGSQLIRKIVPADFGGRASLDFEREGVCYTLRVPMNRLPQRSGLVPA